MGTAVCYACEPTKTITREGAQEARREIMSREQAKADFLKEQRESRRRLQKKVSKERRKAEMKIDALGPVLAPDVMNARADRMIALNEFMAKPFTIDFVPPPPPPACACCGTQTVIRDNGAPSTLLTEDGSGNFWCAPCRHEAFSCGRCVTHAREFFPDLFDRPVPAPIEEPFSTWLRERLAYLEKHPEEVVDEG